MTSSFPQRLMRVNVTIETAWALGGRFPAENERGGTAGGEPSCRAAENQAGEASPAQIASSLPQRLGRVNVTSETA